MFGLCPTTHLVLFDPNKHQPNMITSLNQNASNVEVEQKDLFFDSGKKISAQERISKGARFRVPVDAADFGFEGLRYCLGLSMPDSTTAYEDITLYTLPGLAKFTDNCISFA